MKWLSDTMKQTKISKFQLFTTVENEKIPLKLAESPTLEIGIIDQNRCRFTKRVYSDLNGMVTEITLC